MTFNCINEGSVGSAGGDEEADEDEDEAGDEDEDDGAERTKLTFDLNLTLEISRRKYRSFSVNGVYSSDNFCLHKLA